MRSALQLLARVSFCFPPGPGANTGSIVAVRLQEHRLNRAPLGQERGEDALDPGESEPDRPSGVILERRGVLTFRSDAVVS